MGYHRRGTTEGVPQKGYHAFFSIKPDKRDSARDLCGNCEDQGIAGRSGGKVVYHSISA